MSCLQRAIASTPRADVRRAFASVRGVQVRRSDGVGQLFFPIRPPQPRRRGCLECFRRDVRQSRLFLLRLRRCEPPPFPTVLSKPIVLSWNGRRNCSSCMPFFLWLSQCITPDVSSVNASGPCHLVSSLARFTCHQCRHAHERRRFAPPCRPVATNCSLVTVASMMTSVLYAAGVSLGPALDAPRYAG
jgi:hypothetical protein